MVTASLRYAIMTDTAALSARLQANLDQVQRRMADACARTGRPPESVRLVAVTKTAPLPAIRALLNLGQTTLGENRPQQLLERADLLRGAPVLPHWHLIGQLQRNKVRSLLPAVELIHSVDSLKLLQRIGEVAGELGRRAAVLLQANVSGEANKQGFAPEELERDWDAIQSIPNIDIQGLMTMAPLTEDETLIRGAFRGLRQLRDELQARSPAMSLSELSMGMSGDFELAIEEGATLVRLGSVLFHADDLSG
jgi:pyridoxal phosphate enzyme (YggS family)